MSSNITSCNSCQVNKSGNRNVQQPIIVTTTSMKPFEKMFLDVVGPVETSLRENSYILTMQDDLSKYSIAVPILNHTQLIRSCKHSSSISYACIEFPAQ